MSTPPEEIASQLAQAVAARIGEVLDEAGDEWADELRESISVAVVGKGSKAIRSKPGEPPRKEFGDYADSIEKRSTVDGTTVSTTIGTTSKIGEYLEGGTEKMAPRPHFSPLTLKVAGEVVSKVTDNF